MGNKVDVYIEEEKTQKIDTGNNIICGACRESVSSNASRCPHCGVGFEAPTGILDIIKIVGGAALLIFGGLMLLVGGSAFWDGITNFSIVDIVVGIVSFGIGCLFLLGLTKINLNTSDIIQQ